MGVLARTLGVFLNVGKAPPVQNYGGQWLGTQGPEGNYLRFAHAYTTNEIIFACIDLLADSAGEPQIVGRRFRRESPRTMNRQELRSHQKNLVGRGLSYREADQNMIRNGFYENTPNHPLVQLVNHPNPMTSMGQFWGTVVMDRYIAGNAYALKSRFQTGILKGKTAELWRLRPDRVRIIPKVGGIEGYEYNTGSDKIVYPAEDVIHFKERNPLNDYYGLPPMASLFDRMSIDSYMRNFLRTFFERGGSGPGAVLTVKQKLNQEAKDDVRDRLANMFSGSNSGKTLVIDANEHTYTQLGLNRGLRDALPQEIDATLEARMAMVFRIPGSIVGLKIGYESSSYANKRQDWQVFWDLTMTPLLSDMDDTLNLSLVPEFGGIDDLCFDLGDIRALQEDVDKIQERHRKNLAAGLEFWEEARDAIGLDPDGKGTLLMPSNYVPIVVASPGKIELPEPEIPEAKQIEAPQNIVAEVHCPGKGGESCGRWVGRNVNVGATVYCPKHKDVDVRDEATGRVISIDVVRDDDGKVMQLVGASE